MDSFMDKVAQKLTSQDMIRANGAADAAEIESLENQVALFKDQMEKYDDCIQESIDLHERKYGRGVRRAGTGTADQRKIRADSS